MDKINRARHVHVEPFLGRGLAWLWETLALLSASAAASVFMVVAVDWWVLR
jgi:hypothetical protein